MTEQVYEFRDTIRKIEKRFRPIYDVEKVGAAKTEGQAAPDMVSAGWTIVLTHLGIAVYCQNEPQAKVGDTFVLIGHVEHSPET